MRREAAHPPGTKLDSPLLRTDLARRRHGRVPMAQYDGEDVARSADQE